MVLRRDQHAARPVPLQTPDAARHDAAVELLAGVADGDLYAAAARDQRIRLLSEAGEEARALAEAEAAAAAPGASTADRARLGEVLIGLDRPAAAARAFARAIEARAPDEVAYPEWALWLQLGGAYDEAEDWPRSRDALERAYALAPDQPLVLNYLGYAQLERRENMAEAERLVREAHRLAPDSAAITDSLGWALFLKGERALNGKSALERRGPVDVLRRGSRPDVLLVAVGSMVPMCLAVAERAADHGIEVTVVDPRWVVPVPRSVVELAREHRIVITLEDGVRVVAAGVDAALAVEQRIDQVGLAQAAEVLDAQLGGEQVRDLAPGVGQQVEVLLPGEVLVQLLAERSRLTTPGQAPADRR